MIRLSRVKETTPTAGVGCIEDACIPLEEALVHYPPFFDAVPRVRVRDPLAEFLGAVEGGVIEYRYLDAVRLAGHSCPTVAGAYGLTRLALGALYGAAMAERGCVRATLRDDASVGVAGVVASVVSLLTGACAETGFKGLAGRFERRGLLAFGVEQAWELRFTRCADGASVDAAVNLRAVPADPQMMPLMQRCLAGAADEDERRLFGSLWQDRVRRILLEHGDDPEVFVIRHVD